MSYALSHRLYFYDRWAQLVDIQILREGFSGTPETLIGAANPVTLSMESESQELNSHIRGLVVNLNIIATSIDQHDEFLTYDTRQFKLNLYVASALIFSGFVDPELCSKKLLQKYVFNLKASSGIGYLKNIEFKDSAGKFFTGYKSIYSCIYTCLSHIDDSVKIYDAVDIFGTTETGTSPLTYEYIDTRRFRKSWKESWDCYTVLQELLKAKFAKIMKYRDGWYILPLDYADDTINIRVLEGATGTQTYTLSNVNLKIDISNATAATADLNVPINQSAVVNVIPGWKEITVNYDKGYVNNLFKPYSTKDFTIHRRNNAQPNWTLYMDEEDNTLRLNHHTSPSTTSEDYCIYDCGYLLRDGGTPLKIKFKVSESNLHMRILVYMKTRWGQNWFLAPVSKDSTTEIVLRELAHRLLGINIFQDNTDDDLSDIAEANTWRTNRAYIYSSKEPGTIEITTPHIPVDGNLMIRMEISEDEPSAGAGIYTPSFATLDLNECSVELIKFTDKEKVETYITPGNDKCDYVPPSIELMFGGLPATGNWKHVFYSGIYYLSGINYIPCTVFYSETAEHYGERLMAIYSRPRYILESEVLAHFTPITLPNHLDRVFTMITFRYELEYNIWTIYSLEIKNTSGDNLLLESGEDILLESGDEILLEG